MRWRTGRNRYWHVVHYPVLICDSIDSDPPPSAWRVFRESIAVRHADFDCCALAIIPYPGHPGGFVAPGTRLIYADGAPGAASLHEAIWISHSPECAHIDALDLTHVGIRLYRIWLDEDETLVRMQRMPKDSGIGVFDDEDMCGEIDQELIDLGPEDE